MRIRLETIGDLRKSLRFYSAYAKLMTVTAGISWLFAMINMFFGNGFNVLVCSIATVISLFAGLLLLILSNQEKIKLQLRGL